MTGTAAIIPAKNEDDRIGATVAAALALPGVDLVVVVDDGSTDQTGRVARTAEYVVRHSRNRGKAAAMESGAEAVRLFDGEESRHLLFLDADLGETARAAAPLIEPVAAGEVDMTIAAFVTRVKLGGHGFVVKLAREGVERATGWTPVQPLNGQRCLTRAAFEAARPLAHGFGVETGLTIDLLRKGFRVREVPVEMTHRATGTDWRPPAPSGQAVPRCRPRPPGPTPGTGTFTRLSDPRPPATGLAGVVVAGPARIRGLRMCDALAGQAPCEGRRCGASARADRGHVRNAGIARSAGRAGRPPFLAAPPGPPPHRAPVGCAGICG